MLTYFGCVLFFVLIFCTKKGIELKITPDEKRALTLGMLLYGVNHAAAAGGYEQMMTARLIRVFQKGRRLTSLSVAEVVTNYTLCSRRSMWYLVPNYALGWPLKSWTWEHFLLLRAGTGKMKFLQRVLREECGVEIPQKNVLSSRLGGRRHCAGWRSVSKE